MIPQIKEINFPSYATLHQATVTLEEMGERTISTQVRIDGDITPDFSGWELEFRGERFILPTLKPQASKDNSTRNSLVDLVFTSGSVHELKRYFFAEMSEIEQGTIIIDKYVASLRLNLTNFVAAFNRVLEYYFPDGDFVMNLNPSYPDPGVKDFPIDYMYIWDVLLKFYEIYGVTWSIVTNSNHVNVIRVGYDTGEIDDHIFEYGFNGGLLRFERHVEDTDIYNVLLGRGGEKNLPYRYFKDTDPYNTIWAADPDAIPELKTVYFSRLLDSNFRNYVQGWKAAHYGDTYDATRAETDWAYQKGYTDEKFDPVEYVKDDESIALYGVRQGKLDDNDDIYPTIQGIWLDDIGRADEVVAVEVTSEEDAEGADDQVIVLPDFYEDVFKMEDATPVDITSASFTIPEGSIGRLENAWMNEPYAEDPERGLYGYIDTVNTELFASSDSIPTRVDRFPVSNIPAGGPFYIIARLKLTGGEELRKISPIPLTYKYDVGRFGIKNARIHCVPPDGISYREKFTIWIKNIWDTSKGAGESDLAYAHRVWDPILGDKIGNSAAVSFSDGFMSVSSDYEFLIAKLPEIDRTKTINTIDEEGNPITVQSEWKLTLLRSDAEYEATGLYIPNTKTGGLPVAGDHFFFTGVDLPFQYVKWAEERLTKEKEAALTEKAQTNPTWVIGLDKVRAHQLQEDDFGTMLADKLDVGKKISISDRRFTPGGVLTLGIRTIQFTWNEPSSGNPYIVPDIEITLSDKIYVQRDYNTVKSEIDNISKNYVNESEVKNIVVKTRASSELGIDGDICYLGDIIGTVTE